ncbi:hypothetical protein HanIR_Chr10g0502141 [Helianthus annuus]|nr:hypothetical protein HanIR_Chr10g0502141 [Helianthus annuus]
MHMKKNSSARTGMRIMRKTGSISGVRRRRVVVTGGWNHKAGEESGSGSMGMSLNLS